MAEWSVPVLLTHKIFFYVFSLLPSWGEKGQSLWRAPGIQPGPMHHKHTKKHVLYGNLKIALTAKSLFSLLLISNITTALTSPYILHVSAIKNPLLVNSYHTEQANVSACQTPSISTCSNHPVSSKNCQTIKWASKESPNQMGFGGVRWSYFSITKTFLKHQLSKGSSKANWIPC